MIKECECFKDQMTPKERMAAFAVGKEIDRIPCIPLLGEPSTRFIGTTLSRYYHSAELMAEAEIAAFRMFRHDSVGVGPSLHGITEAMGTELAFPEDGFATVSNPVLKDYKDLDRLSPVNPYKDGRLPLYLKALKLIDEQIGDQVGVGSSVGGPFTIAAGLRGTENFLRDLRNHPEMAHRLLKLATESAINYIDAICDLGFTPSIAEPTASGTMISLKSFREFAKPYLKIYVDRIRELKGKGPTMHICGDTRRIWEDMADTGATVLSLDNQVDLSEAKARVGDRVCLMGNIPPAEVILKGTPQQVRDAARECMRKAYDNPGGFILSTGCQIPPGSPVENINTMMEVARTYGKWPIDPEKLF